MKTFGGNTFSIVRSGVLYFAFCDLWVDGQGQYFSWQFSEKQKNIKVIWKKKHWEKIYSKSYMKSFNFFATYFNFVKLIIFFRCRHLSIFSFVDFCFQIYDLDFNIIMNNDHLEPTFSLPHVVWIILRVLYSFFIINWSGSAFVVKFSNAGWTLNF